MICVVLADHMCVLVFDSVYVVYSLFMAHPDIASSLLGVTPATDSPVFADELNQQHMHCAAVRCRLLVFRYGFTTMQRNSCPHSQGLHCPTRATCQRAMMSVLLTALLHHCWQFPAAPQRCRQWSGRDGGCALVVGHV